MTAMLPTPLEIEQWHDFLSLLAGVFVFYGIVSVVSSLAARRVVTAIEKKRDGR